MQLPLQVTFRNLHPSAFLEAKIREKAAKLDQVFDGITRCDVVVERPHHDHRKGWMYHVRIDLTVPGGRLAVRGDDRHAHENPRAAIRSAFDAARRQLGDWIARKRNTEAMEAAD
ncbi:MAG TPA: HPF/RaiA family ribosome-associated protein [Azospirillum sp.]|nr:HPF/RaiA family ribosome-associated protein [Azospirillum sp.]